MAISPAAATLPVIVNPDPLTLRPVADAEPTTTHVLFAVGSLRAKSFSGQLARMAADILREHGAAVDTLDFADLPLMDQDAEFPAPHAVERIRHQLAHASGLWIFSPEYNHGIPGGLKNALDWLSRPVAPGGRSAAYAKPVTVSGAGGASAGNCVQDHLLSVLATMRMNVMGVPRVAIALDAGAFATDELPDPADARAALARQAESFLRFMRLGGRA